METLMKTMILVALVIAAGMVITGCEDKEETRAATTGQDPADAVVQVAQTKCPIMGNAIKKDIYVDYQGKRIYMCCPGCKGKFNEDPEKFIKKMQDQGITLSDVPADDDADDDDDDDDDADDDDDDDHEGHNH